MNFNQYRKEIFKQINSLALYQIWVNDLPERQILVLAEIQRLKKELNIIDKMTVLEKSRRVEFIEYTIESSLKYLK